jgi:hypothetical protein
MRTHTRTAAMTATLNALLIAFALVLVAPAHAEEAPAATQPGSADTFERELLSTLKASHSNKRGITLHVDGESFGGVVVAIGPDVVVLSNREHGRILVRRERIAAAKAN